MRAHRSQLERQVLAISPMSPPALRALVDAFAPITIAEGACFARARSLCTRVALVVRGTLRAFFTNDRGREYTKDFFCAPSFVGAPSSIFEGRPSTVTIVAETRAELLASDWSTLEQLFDTSPELGRFGRRVIAQAYAEREQKEHDLAVLSAKERYLRLRARFPELEACVPQYQIASYLGITPTQLSRIRVAMQRAPA